MPFSRSSKRFTGFLSIEEVEGSENFTQRFFQLKKPNSQLEYYDDDPSQSGSCHLIGTFNLMFLSLVEESSRIRPNIPHGFYITLCGQKHFLSAASDEDRSNWIKAIGDSFQISEAHLRFQSLRGSQGYSSSVLGSDEGGNKSGYCIKQGLKRKNWKRRYFVLDSYGLAYYISHEESCPIKMINLADICQARVSVGIHLNKHNVFEVVTPQRVFYIQAESAFERESWINAINRRAGAMRRSKYMRLASASFGSTSGRHVFLSIDLSMTV